MLTEKLLRLTIAFGSEWVMVLLLILSALSLAVIVERLLFYRRRRSSLDGIDAKLSAALGRGGADQQERAHTAERVRTAVYAAQNEPLIAAASARPGDQLEAVEKQVAALLARDRLKLESRLGFLGTLGSNAPFIGLFGTVLGIIRAFNDLSLDSKGGSSAVMAGISEALVATAIGLFVAIPAVMAYNFFQRQLDHIASVTESLAQSILAEHLRWAARPGSVTAAARGGARDASAVQGAEDGPTPLDAEESPAEA